MHNILLRPVGTIRASNLYYRNLKYEPCQGFLLNPNLALGIAVEILFVRIHFLLKTTIIFRTKRLQRIARPFDVLETEKGNAQETKKPCQMIP